MEHTNIPDIIVGRLPVYLNMLQRLLAENVLVTSSKELGDLMGISAAQIRKDLSQFGEFGKQGRGYSIVYLIEELQNILNLNEIWELVIVGSGSLGRAIANYPGFKHNCFKVTMIFDNNPQIVGSRIGEFVVKSTETMDFEIRNSGVKIAMLTLPASVAQITAENLVNAGILAILNYAPISLKLPDGILVQYLNPVQNLQHMTYYLK